MAIGSHFICGEWTVEAFRFLLQQQTKWPENFLTTYSTLKRIDISTTDSCANAHKLLIETSINEDTVDPNIEVSDDVEIILSFSFIGRHDQGHYGLLRIHKKIELSRFMKQVRMEISFHIYLIYVKF